MPLTDVIIYILLPLAVANLGTLAALYLKVGKLEAYNVATHRRLSQLERRKDP